MESGKLRNCKFVSSHYSHFSILNSHLSISLLHLLPYAFAAGDGGAEVEDEDAVFDEREGKAESAVNLDAVFAEEWL